MPLNPVQIAFLNEAARPHMETLVRNLHELDTWVADYDALQAGPDNLPQTTAILDDGRADAPALTGANVKALRDFSENMSAIVTPGAKQVLTGLMVRSLSAVLRLD